MMCLVFVPDYTETNPYQSNLAAALDREVVFGDDEFLPVVRALWNRDVSVVHYHWMGQYFNAESHREQALKFALFAFQLLAVRISGVSVVWTVHNVAFHDSDYPRLERWFKRWFVRSGMCDRLIVHCASMTDVVMDTFDLPASVRERIDVIPHGNYLDNYETGVSKSEARAELGIDESATVFLFFGMIRRYKGVFDLIDAFREASVPDSRLLIAGNPRNATIERELEAHTDDDEAIHGVFEYIPDECIQYYMSAADTVVLPFRDITTSGSTVLAMSFGKAIVVPTVGCLPELLDEDGAVLYSHDQSDALRNALETVATRDTDRMGAHNLERIRQYDWDSIADRTNKTYALTN